MGLQSRRAPWRSAPASGNPLFAKRWPQRDLHPRQWGGGFCRPATCPRVRRCREKRGRRDVSDPGSDFWVAPHVGGPAGSLSRPSSYGDLCTDLRRVLRAAKSGRGWRDGPSLPTSVCRDDPATNRHEHQITRSRTRLAVRCDVASTGLLRRPLRRNMAGVLLAPAASGHRRLQCGAVLGASRPRRCAPTPQFRGARTLTPPAPST